MSKFKVGDKIVRVAVDAKWAPIGHRSVVLYGNMYLDALNEINDIIDNYWELAEEATPVFTQEMSDKKELPSIGSYFLSEGKKVKTLSTTKEEGGVVTFLTDKGGIACCWNNASWVHPITPAPIKLIDGNAYMFDYGGMENVRGIYDAESERFYFTKGRHVSVSNCMLIRPMTVAESK